LPFLCHSRPLLLELLLEVLELVQDVVEACDGCGCGCGRRHGLERRKGRRREGERRGKGRAGKGRAAAGPPRLGVKTLVVLPVLHVRCACGVGSWVRPRREEEAGPKVQGGGKAAPACRGPRSSS